MCTIGASKGPLGHTACLPYCYCTWKRERRGGGGIQAVLLFWPPNPASSQIRPHSGPLEPSTVCPTVRRGRRRHPHPAPPIGGSTNEGGDDSGTLGKLPNERHWIGRETAWQRYPKPGESKKRRERSRSLHFTYVLPVQ